MLPKIRISLHIINHKLTHSRNMNIIKAISLTAILAFSSFGLASAQTDFYFETRLAYEAESLGGELQSANSMFKGQWLNMRLDGQIVPGLTYSYRQRFNKPNAVTFFDSTDWLHLDWKFADRWSLSFGKQVVAIGGYEYDRAPIDLYYCSDFWNHIPCYQIGGSVSYDVTGSDNVLFQVCNSPFRSEIGNNHYGFNLFWSGRHGMWQTLWSVNMAPYGGGDYMNYIALGNRFVFTDWLRWDIDWMNRYSNAGPEAGDFLLDDWSLMTEVAVAPSEAVSAFAKYTFDTNSRMHGDYLVAVGTRLSMVSAGVEITPLKAERNAIKLFCVGGYRFGEGVETQLLVEAGVKFRMDVLRVIKSSGK